MTDKNKKIAAYIDRLAIFRNEFIKIAVYTTTVQFSLARCGCSLCAKLLVHASEVAGSL